MIIRNIMVFKWYYFFWRFKPLAALMAIYFSQITNSYAQAMGIFSVFNISYMLLKLPSGYISDKIGRKPVIICGSFLLFISFLTLAISGEYKIVNLLFLFAFLWGIGEALISGSTDALMYETMDELKRSNEFKFLYSRSMVSDQLGCGLAALTTMFITYYFSLQTVAWFAVFPSLFQFMASLYFIEASKKRKTTKLAQNNIFLVLKQFIRNKKLCFYAIMDIFFGTLGDVSHRFEGIYFKTFATDWIISLARVLKHMFGVLGFYLIPYIKRYKPEKLYFGSIICNLFFRILSLIFNNIFSPFIHIFLNFFYATGATAKTDILQHEFLASYRASGQSIILFIKSLFMALVMYLIGIIADLWGIFSAMVILVILRVIGLSMAFIWSRYN